MTTWIHLVLPLLLTCIHSVQSNLIVANGTNIVKIDTSNSNIQTVLYDGLQRAVGVAVDVAENKLFWTDVETGSIYYGSVDGTQPATEIVSGLGRPNGIAIDWITNNIYWTDGLFGTIDVAKYDGSQRRTLLYGLSNPRSITLDPVKGDMYWTDQDTETVERAKMDGENPQSLVNTDLYWPNEIVIDSQGALYWIDGYYRKIQKLLTSGSQPASQVVDLSSLSTDAMFGLSLHGSTLYFTVWGDVAGSVYSVPTSGGTPSLLADDFSDKPFGLAISDPAVQWGTSNGCTSVSNPCSHLCLPTGPTDRSCACPSYDDMTLSSDGVTCTFADEFLLYCAGGDGQIHMLALDGHESGRSIVVDQTARCVALDYDAPSGMIYYSDVAFREIRRVDLNGENSETFLLKGIGIVDGLAIDQLHRRLYFTNWNFVYATNTGEEWARIEMIDLDGSNRRRIIESGLYRPRAINLDVQNGYMYYTDWNVHPGIFRTDLDGQNRLVIQSQNIENPNGLALTPSSIYWIDSHYNSDLDAVMEYSDLDGNNRQEVTYNFPMKVPFDMDIANGKVYWSDWNETAIFEGDLTTGNHRKLVGGVIDAMGIKYATRSGGPTEPVDDCTASSCPICIVGNAEENAKCVCPDKGGKVSGDNGQCTEPSSFLLVADVMDVRMVGLDSSDRYGYAVVQAYEDDNIVAIAYDSTNRKLYWSNVHDGAIRRADFFNSEDHEDFYNGAYVIDGMDIDEANQMIYWTDYELKTIERMSLSDVDGSTHEVLKTNLTSPRSIVVHNGYVYWTDWTPGDAKVVRMNINTKVEEDIIQSGLQTPNGLAISNKKVYVIDGDGLKIIRTSLDGSNEETLSFLTGRFNHGYGLQVVGNSLLFTSWDDNAVYLANTQSKRVEKILDGLIRPTEIILIGGTDGCSPDYDCSDLCEEVPGGYHCLCNSGEKLDEDMKTCITCSDTWLVTSPSLCTSQCHINADCTEDVCNPDQYRCVCKGGYQGDGSSCTECPVNTYKETHRTANCQNCQAHSSTKGYTGRTQCTCDDNYIRDSNGTCVLGEPLCGDLTKPNHGDLLCGFENTVYKCELQCDEGYMPAPSQETQFICQSNGQWHGTISPDSCVGTSPPRTPTPSSGTPVFTQCPDGDLIFNVPPDGDTVDIDADIRAEDGNGNVIPHEIVGDLVQIPGRLQFSEQTDAGINVRVKAVDGEEEVWCEFRVIVRDPHPPTITYCPLDQTVPTSESKARVYWEEPRATDNTELPSISTSRESGSEFSVGSTDGVQTHTVTVTATDTSGNMATCSFDITITHDNGGCEVLDAPQYGALTCGSTVTGYQCALHCIESAVPTGEVSVFYCTAGSWTPNSQPSCSRLAPGSDMTAFANFIYRGACALLDSTQFIKNLRARIRKHNLCSLGDSKVCTDDSFTLRCGRSSRRKRQTENDLIVKLEIKISNDVNDSPIEDEEESFDLLETMQRDMNNTMDIIEYLVKNGSLDLEINGTVIQSDPNSFDVSEPVWTCFEGHMTTTDGCVPCPAGSYYDQSMNECIFCPENEYQTEEAQLECEKCEDGTFTEGIGNYRESHCLTPPTKADEFPLVIVIVVVVVVVVLVIIIVVVVVMVKRNKNGAKSKKDNEYARNNEGFYDEIDDGKKPKRLNTVKVGKAMYDGGECENPNDYTSLEDVKIHEYETLKSKDGNLAKSEDIEFKHNDLAAANTFTGSTNGTAEEKV